MVWFQEEGETISVLLRESWRWSIEFVSISQQLPHVSLATVVRWLEQRPSYIEVVSTLRIRLIHLLRVKSIKENLLLNRLLAENTCSVTTLLRIDILMGVFSTECKGNSCKLVDITQTHSADIVLTVAMCGNCLVSLVSFS